jgi:CubicO group peptidase (beta-lactamase class C family)
MKTNYSLITLITTTLFRTNNRTASGCISETLTAFNVPGIAVAIIKDGKVVLAKGMVKIHRYKRKVDANTLFGIASNSKTLQAHP